MLRVCVLPSLFLAHSVSLTSFGFAFFFTFFLTSYSSLFSFSSGHSQQFSTVLLCLNMFLLSPSFPFTLSNFLPFYYFHFIVSYVRVFAFICFVCSFCQFFVCLFVSISYICLLAKFIRFSSSVFTFFFFFSFHLSLSFHLILLLSFNSTFILFFSLSTLLSQSHSFFSFLTTSLPSKFIHNKLYPFHTYTRLFAGNFSVSQESQQYSMILTRSNIYTLSHALSLPITKTKRNHTALG